MSARDRGNMGAGPPAGPPAGPLGCDGASGGGAGRGGKKPYDAPRLVELGTFRELTREGTFNPTIDILGGFGGPPPDHDTFS